MSERRINWSQIPIRGIDSFFSNCGDVFFYLYLPFHTWPSHNWLLINFSKSRLSYLAILRFQLFIIKFPYYPRTIQIAGVNFINVLQAAFAHIDPKILKRYWRLDWILMLWGAMGVKAACKYVSEIEPQLMAKKCNNNSIKNFFIISGKTLSS